ncbi:MAG: family 20 glycosylhydrolase [Fimbriimonadaceae bacterium]|nr:family 20 glycosylhydrolase [Fimbriimonadaceae bacterium]
MRAWLFCALCLTPLAAQENLALNGSFEQAATDASLPAGWELQRQNDARGTFALDPAQRVDGRQSLRIEHPEADAKWIRASLLDLPAQPRTLYRIDLQVRAAGAYNVLLYEFVADATEATYVTHQVGTGTGTAGQWISLGKSVVTGPQAGSFKISCIAQGPGTVWFDEVRLVKVAGVPDGEAVAVNAAPRVDGQLDDPAWRAAPAIGPLYLLGSSGERPAAATLVRAVWTSEQLYLAFECVEPQPAAMVAKVTEPDGPVYLDDSIEAFLDPEQSGSGYAHLAVNSRGLGFDQRRLGSTLNSTWYTTRGNQTSDWDPRWQAAAAVAPPGWTVELAVPFAALGGTPQPGDVWAANFCRERYAQPELSTWAPLQGETFLQPDQFGRLIFRARPSGQPTVVTRPAAAAATALPLVPRPQQLRRGDGLVTLRGPLRLQPAGPEAARYLAALAPLLGGATVLPVSATATPGALQVRSLSDPRAETERARRSESDAQWQANPEGYRLQLAADRLELVGSSAAGVRCGLLTVAQLLRPTTAGATLPQLEIVDWPDLAIRAWHVGGLRAADRAVYQNWIETLARLKYNTLMIEVNDSLRYESHPEIGLADAPSKAEMREMVAGAKALGFDVIPQVQVYGHFNWVLDKPGWADLAENPQATGRWGRWNANIRDPRYYPLVFDLYQVAIDVFQPRIFHIGHDEITFQPIGVHPATRDTAPHLLLVEEVTKLYAWLRAKNLQVMMWGDQLLREHHGGPGNTWQAVDLLPKDIIIADWHYEPAEQYPSVSFFRQKGYPVVACGWWDPLNMMNFASAAVDARAQGFSGTSWWRLHQFVESAEHQTAFVLGAENSWSNRRPSIDQLGYQPQAVWRRLAGWGPAAAETRYVTCDLSRHANQSLADNRRRLGWLGLGPEQDLASVPRGLQWFNGVPFRVLEGTNEVVMLAAAGDPPRSWPSSARSIGVGSAARALWLLATTSAPTRRTGDIYQRGALYPKLLGRLVVYYADGSTAEVPLSYRREVTDWNAGLPPARGLTAWSGQTAGGAYAMLSQYRWDNPHPEKVIETVDLRALEAPLRLVLVGLTAALP